MSVVAVIMQLKNQFIFKIFVHKKKSYKRIIYMLFESRRFEHKLIALKVL